MPVLCRPAQRHAALSGSDELLFLKRIEVLPHGHRGHLQPFAREAESIGPSVFSSFTMRLRVRLSPS